MIFTKIVDSRIIEDSISLLQSENIGSVIRFNGCIRNIENENKITGIFYECYHEMAVSEFNRLANSTIEKFKIESILCIHRTGFIPVGESAIYLEIHSKHRQESFEAMAWFMDKLKVDVPIWKRINE